MEDNNLVMNWVFLTRRNTTMGVYYDWELEWIPERESWHVNWKNQAKEPICENKVKEND